MTAEKPLFLLIAVGFDSDWTETVALESHDRRNAPGLMLLPPLVQASCPDG